MCVMKSPKTELNIFLIAGRGVSVMSDGEVKTHGCNGTSALTRISNVDVYITCIIFIHSHILQITAYTIFVAYMPLGYDSRRCQKYQIFDGYCRALTRWCVKRPTEAYESRLPSLPMLLACKTCRVSNHLPQETLETK